MYQLTRTEVILRLADSAYIPAAKDNSDYMQYLLWLEEGNTPQEAEPVPIVIPQEVTKFQAKAALLKYDLLDIVESTIKSSDPLTKLAWGESLTFKRNSDFLISVAAKIGITEKQIDDLFIYADTVK
jgi:hypothetical protein